MRINRNILIIGFLVSIFGNIHSQNEILIYQKGGVYIQKSKLKLKEVNEIIKHMDSLITNGHKLLEKKEFYVINCNIYFTDKNYHLLMGKARTIGTVRKIKRKLIKRLKNKVNKINVEFISFDYLLEIGDIPCSIYLGFIIDFEQ